MKPQLELSEISDEHKIDVNRTNVLKRPNINFGFQRIDDSGVLDDEYYESILHSEINDSCLRVNKPLHDKNYDDQKLALNKEVSRESRDFNRWINTQISQIDNDFLDSIDNVIKPERVNSSRISNHYDSEKRLSQGSQFETPVRENRHMTQNTNSDAIEESPCINTDIQCLEMIESNAFFKTNRMHVAHMNNETERQIMPIINKSLEDYEEVEANINLEVMFSEDKRGLKKNEVIKIDMDKSGSCELVQNLMLRLPSEEISSKTNGAQKINYNYMTQEPRKLNHELQRPQLIPKSIKDIRLCANKCSLENSQKNNKNQHGNDMGRTFTLSEFNDKLVLNNNDIKPENVEGIEKLPRISLVELFGTPSNQELNKQVREKSLSVLKGFKALTPSSKNRPPLFSNKTSKNNDSDKRVSVNLSVSHDNTHIKIAKNNQHMQQTHLNQRMDDSKIINENRRTWNEAQELSACSFTSKTKDKVSNNKIIKPDVSPRLNKSVNTSVNLRKEKPIEGRVGSSRYNNNTSYNKINLNQSKLNANDLRDSKIIGPKTPLKKPVSDTMKAKAKDITPLVKNQQSKNNIKSPVEKRMSTKPSTSKLNTSHHQSKSQTRGKTENSDVQIREKLLEEIYHALDKIGCLTNDDELCDIELNSSKIKRILQNLDLLPLNSSEITNDMKKLLHVMWMIISVEETKPVTVKELTIFILAIYGMSIVDLLDNEDTFLAQSDVQEIQTAYRPLKLYKEKRESLKSNQLKKSASNIMDVSKTRRKNVNDSKMAESRKQKTIEKAQTLIRMGLLTSVNLNNLTHTDLMVLESQIKTIEKDLLRREKENEQLSQCRFKPTARTSHVSGKNHNSGVDSTQSNTRSLFASELNRSLAAIKLDIKIAEGVKERVYIYPDMDVNEQIIKIAAKFGLNKDNTDKLRTVLLSQINCM